MKIAIVGSGISGLTCAYLLAESHSVTLFEKDDRLGGHTNTVQIEHEGRPLAVDTGFIVFNEQNYPNFCRLMNRLGVESRPTTMSFSVRDDSDDFEYGGSSAAGFVGTWKNLFRPRWWSVARGIARLAHDGTAALSELPPTATISDLCTSGRFSREFLKSYLLPMAAAIWSAPHDDLMRFPARFFLRFFYNHGMLDLRRRPQWRTVVGGSARYIDAMMRALGHRVDRRGRVTSISRHSGGAVVQSDDGERVFDAVILAAHSDQALSLLTDPTPTEREVLGAMPYQANDVVLHSDIRLLPRRQRCWAAWNYVLAGNSAHPAVVTYNMSMLQGLETQTPLCVTLNATERVDPARIIRRFTYAHPLYTMEGERARARWSEISGVRHTHYCGAYWGNGFHEDGVNSALRVCEQLGVAL